MFRCLVVFVVLTGSVSLALAENAQPVFCRHERVCELLGDHGAVSVAIKKSRGKLSEFQGIWKSRGRYQDSFVAVAVTIGKRAEIEPIGVLVEEMNPEGVRGKLLYNQLPFGSKTGAVVQLNWDAVIDWHYSDCLMMKGGDVYRACLPQLDVRTSRNLRDQLHCCLNPAADYRAICDLIRSPSVGGGKRFSRESQYPAWTINNTLHQYRCVSPVELTIGELNSQFGSRESTLFLNEQALLAQPVEANLLVSYTVPTENVEVCRALADLGYSLDAIDEECGWSPLIVAIAAGRRSIAECLLELGADVMTRGFGGRTALFFARDPGAINLLVRYGIDIEAVDEDEKRAADVFSVDGKIELLSLLIRKGSRASTLEADEPIGSREFSYHINYGACLPVVELVPDKGRD